MKMVAVLCCLSIGLNLAIVTAIKTLYNIEDLKQNTAFGKEFPRHGLLLLHWFSNNIEMDQNGVIKPFRFYPGRGDYGFQRYPNSETDKEVLPEISKDKLYYSLGVLKLLRTRTQLPSYITQDYYNSGQYLLKDIDRIVIRVNRYDTNVVDEVYITQDDVNMREGSGYDSNNTYTVKSSLLREIQTLDLNTMCENLEQEKKVKHLQRAYPDIPGLARFLVLAGYDINSRLTAISQSLSCTLDEDFSLCQVHSSSFRPKCELQNKIHLKVKSTKNGCARITWSGIPEYLLQTNLVADVFENKDSLSNPEARYLNGKVYGSIITKMSLKPGLQIRLLQLNLAGDTVLSTVWKGPEFDGASRVLPTNLKDFQASLQLYAEDSYASARLYIKKSFSNWQSTFKTSWVGFYASISDKDGDYGTYQYIEKFKKSDVNYAEDYDIYEYKSKMYISPAVQARFFLDKDYTNLKASTEPWEGVVDPQTVLEKDSE